MKKLLLALLAAASLYAEATFDQVQDMINTKDYKQAALALTVITINHPTSAKPFYALAQAQAGLGNLQAARDAFAKAKALNPKLDFVPESQVKDFAKTINTVIEVKKIEQESHWFLWLVGLSSMISIWFFFFRKKPMCPTETKIKDDIPAYTSRPKRSTKIYSNRPDDTSSPILNEPSGCHHSYSSPRRPSDVHHYYHDQSGGSNLGTTILASAATAAVVSSLMDNDSHSHRSDSTESYRPSYITPDEPISNSWNDSTPSTSTSWEDTSSTSSRSTSWNDSSSSSSSWSDSSSSSSSDSSSSWD